MSATDLAVRPRRDWWLNGLARSLAVVLFGLFVALLWQAIEIGSTNTSFQHMATQIATFDASVQRLQLANRDAEIKYSHLASLAPTTAADTATMAEADRARGYAADDLEFGAGRYLAAVCDTGTRLAQVGGLPKRFLPTTNVLTDCPERVMNLGAGVIAAPPSGKLSATQYVEAVTVILDHYTVVAGSYVLPILFGMLGALIFVIRDMVTVPAHMDDLPVVVSHVLRLLLGAIFGLIIGYVNLASTPAAGLAASPLLLSLVGGYATDAVLSILDRVGTAMSYGDDRGPNGAAEGQRARRTSSSGVGPSALPGSRAVAAPVGSVDGSGDGSSEARS